MISALLVTERSITPLERGAPFLWSEIWPTLQRGPATGQSGRDPGVFDGSEFQPFSGGFAPENTFHPDCNHATTAIPVGSPSCMATRLRCNPTDTGGCTIRPGSPIVRGSRALDLRIHSRWGQICRIGARGSPRAGFPEPVGMSGEAQARHSGSADRGTRGLGSEEHECL